MRAQVGSPKAHPKKPVAIPLYPTPHNSRAHTGGSKHLPTRPFVTIDKTITNKQKTTNNYVDTTMEDG